MGIERLFEEAQQVYNIDELIQAAPADRRELSSIAISKDTIVNEAISPERSDVREEEGRSMRDIHLTLQMAMAFIANVFGRKVLAGR
ncbi:hypothetical protein [Rhizobium mesosinicum]|uniref:Uncharacterized protein n=1 Tax=Rhizobium mesosinicum TaxID=335017 RepID=A0ABS7GYH4_9HYPH|nr:hypothetical protein [Rhizobium mesosinicum]MBW9054930.1 hypothetical protein [Rhizobium mesosinicum]